MKQIFGLILVVLFAGSCAKKYGCEDKGALNYSQTAKRSDGSCYYLSKTYFKWSKYHVDDIIAAGHVYFSIYVNGVLIGSDSTKNHQYNFPFDDKDDFPGVIYVDTVFSETQHYILKCVDQDGFVMFENGASFRNEDYFFEIPFSL